jgi:hypothetical protein
MIILDLVGLYTVAWLLTVLYVRKQKPLEEENCPCDFNPFPFNGCNRECESCKLQWLCEPDNYPKIVSCIVNAIGTIILPILLGLLICAILRIRLHKRSCLVLLLKKVPSV